MMQSGSSGTHWVGGPFGEALALGGPARRRPLGRWAVLIWGGLAYGLFVLSAVRFIGFVSGLAARNVDSGPGLGFWAALGFDLPLVLVLGLQHGLMSRSGFKRWWTRQVPPAAERATFVAAASLSLLLLVGQWRGVPDVIWHVAGPLERAAIWGAAAFGWTLVVGSTFMLDHLETLGLRQVFCHFQGRSWRGRGLRSRWAYRFVRQPLLGGMLIGLWAAPTLTVGRALLAGLLTVFILVGLLLEERSPSGETWEAYRDRVPPLDTGQLGRRQARS